MKIRNKRTGEIVEIPDTEAQNYNISLRAPTPAQSSVAVYSTGQTPQTMRYQEQTNPYATVNDPYSQGIVQEEYDYAPKITPQSPEYWMKPQQQAIPEMNQLVPVQKSAWDQFKEYQTPEGGFTPMGFVRNWQTDTGNFVKGIASIPKIVGMVAQNPLQIIPMGVTIAGSILKDYADIITRAPRTLYERPLTGTLDFISLVVPLVKGYKAMKSAKTAGQLAKAESYLDGIKSMGIGLDDLDDVPTVAKKLGMSIDDLGDIDKVSQRLNVDVDDLLEASAKAQGAPYISTPYEDLAVRTYANAFQVPTKRAKDLKPMNTFSKIMKYDIGDTFNDLKRTISKVTGDTGDFNKATEKAVGMIDGNIPIDDVSTNMRRVIDESLDISVDDANKMMSEVVNKMKPVSGLEGVGQMDPTDALQLARKLERKGWFYKSKSTYLSPNPRYEDIGNVYIEGAKGLMDQLEQAVDTQGLVPLVLDKNFLTRIKAISPQLAKDASKIRTLKEIRSIQAPFVRMGQIIDLTEQAQLSAAAKFGGSLSTRLGTAATGGALFGVPGAIVGSAVAPIVESTISTTGARYAPNISMAVARKLATPQAQSMSQFAQNLGTFTRGAVSGAIPKVGVKNITGVPLLGNIPMIYPTGYQSWYQLLRNPERLRELLYGRQQQSNIYRQPTNVNQTIPLRGVPTTNSTLTTGE